MSVYLDSRISIAILRAIGCAATLAVASEIERATAQPLSLFRTEVQAQQHCPDDSVVWLDFQTQRYYVSGQRRYGRGFNGTFVCRAAARKNGYRRSLLGR
jgi:hypothetical protein